MYSAYRKLKIPEIDQPLGTGWLPPLPDLRDYTEEHPEVVQMVKKMGIPLTIGKMFGRPRSKPPKPPGLPHKTDLRPWCSDVEDQGGLGSCTANAAAGVVEYFEHRAFSKYVDASRLFIYKTTRNLMNVTGDTGAWLRTTMGALVLFGTPPEKYWPYTDRDPDFDAEPSSFVYAMAGKYEAIKYFCHDPLGKNIPPEFVLESVKKYLAAGIPSMFGFYGFPSFDQSDVKGGIPYPCPGEQAQWGHAVVAMGYDDSKDIENLASHEKTKGALLIRNSWRKTWGDKGYGWLPYKYVEDGLALDFWSLIRMGWVDTGLFGLK